MTKPLRVGVIGANPNRSWAKDSHIPALRSLEHVQLAAVATIGRASADAAAAAFGEAAILNANALSDRAHPLFGPFHAPQPR